MLRFQVPFFSTSNIFSSIFSAILLVHLPTSAAADESFCPSWREGNVWPKSGVANPACEKSENLDSLRREGLIHALNYPVSVTGLLIPQRPIAKTLESDGNPFSWLISSVAKLFSGFGSITDVYESVGLYAYPNTEGSGPYLVPWNGAAVPSHPMGTTFIERNGAVGVTFACVSCHAGQMFGRPIIGMPNRFPKASEFFLQGIKLTSKVSPAAFRLATGATAAETRMYKETGENLRFIEALPQRAPGLDTPLAQVALSLSHREPGGSAAKTATYAKRPREEALRHAPSDTKPGTWWNVRYKNRWLLDGSVLSGNPILTNLLWNEIGRGADLNTVSAWIRANPRVIASLTTAVFRSEPPPLSDFFPSQHFDLAAARRGQQLFLERCASCHGVYEKAWDQPGASDLTKAEQMRTTQVSYHARTPVVDVGTDTARYLAMRSLEQLNRLDFSREFGIRVQAQSGYVPPPLVGIWLRYPYLHNNSVSSLCELLTPSPQRAKRYVAVEAEDENRDFDFACNGYPKSDAAAYASAPRAMRFDTTLPGLSNQGHDQGIFMLGDQEWLSAADKSDLIRFLQTL